MLSKKLLIANWLINPDNPGGLPLAEAEKKIRELGLEKIYREVELPLVEVLAAMRKTGVALDVQKLNRLQAEYEEKISRLTGEIYEVAGEEFNINSPRQLARVLTKLTKREWVSTDAEQLLAAKETHSIINLILSYREHFKIKSTYIEPLLKCGDRVRTTFIQTGTSTGRLSSQDPNLQNIPPVIKEVFIADKGYTMVSFDYSQLQLRILAAVAEDKKMIEAFAKDIDIHALTASQVFNVPVEKVTPKMRQLAKTLNFGVVYGMGASAFARVSGLSREKARDFIAEYFSDFQDVKKWQEKVKQEARKNGYVENLNGRKRWLPAILSVNRRLAAEAERMAVNMPIQSLEADIIKLAMIKVYKNFKKSSDVKLLLSIHDELLFEIKSDKVKGRIPQILDIMENIYELTVRLKVKVSQGKSWHAVI